MSDGKNTQLADALAEAGRKVGQAVTDAIDAVAGVASRPEVRAVVERAERLFKHRPCLCFCVKAHPDDRGICEAFDAVITGQHNSDLLADVGVPLCAPCAAARAAREFAD